MTTLAGIQGKGWCVIGAESKISDDSGVYVITPSPKVFWNNNILIAGCGSVRGLNILEHGFDAPHYDPGYKAEMYLTREFIPEMRKLYIEHGSDMKDYDTVATMENGLLVGVGGRLFSIGGDYSWDQNASGLYHYGSGGPYALGAMVALRGDRAKTVEEANEIVINAVGAAIKCDVFSGGKVSTFVQYAGD